MPPARSNMLKVGGRQSQSRLIAPIEADRDTMTIGHAISRSYFVFVQVDVLEDVHILFIFVGWKVRRHNDDLEAVRHLGLCFEIERFW